jgi:hypothetical protein
MLYSLAEYQRFDTLRWHASFCPFGWQGVAKKTRCANERSKNPVQH